MNPLRQMGWWAYYGTNNNRAWRLNSAFMASIVVPTLLAFAGLGLTELPVDTSIGAWWTILPVVAFIGVYGYTEVVAETRTDRSTVETLTATIKLARYLAHDRTLSKSWRQRAKFLAKVARAQRKRQGKLATLLGDPLAIAAPSQRLYEAARALAEHSLMANTAHAEVLIREVDLVLASYRELEAA